VTVQFRRRARPDLALNIAPLIDVVFLLVIFFAVSTTFLDTAGLRLDLPESTSTASRSPEDLTVVLTKDGTIVFEGEKIETDRLEERLRQELVQRDDKTVVLRADSASTHGQVVAIMDRIRAAGAAGLTVAAHDASER
jgi:biopolymer transport protein ExbD